MDEQTVTQLEAALRRIFLMKITRSTMREVQNVLIQLANGDKDTVNTLLEGFFRGEMRSDLAKGKGGAMLQKLAHEYCVPVRLAKEVFERGEFVMVISSDTLAQKDKIAFVNRLRRIDGDEFLFITDLDSTVHFLNHFASRLQDVLQSEKGDELLKPYKKDLQAVQKRLEEISVSA